MRNNILPILLIMVFLASCASHKTITDNNVQPQREQLNPSSNSTNEFLKKVINAGVTTENIVGSASVTLKFGDKDITVPGSVHMRRDKVIRIQLFVPILGTEVGRMEFTPDYVLIVDRMNKQYIKGDYNQLDFLRDNGISFYSLQALFWNQLIAPNKQKITSAETSLFTADLSATGASVPVKFSQGKINYSWNVSRADNTITSAEITYNSLAANASKLSWLYSDFKPVGNKKFPRTQDFTFQTLINNKKQQGEIMIKMSEVKTTADWEIETEVSKKYKQVSAEAVFSKLMSF